MVSTDILSCENKISQNMNNTNDSNKEKNILLYDKSTKIGSIYFFGINSNFYRGKIIIKKHIISDKIIRYTNLSESLSLIQNGDYNIRQIAILIKGIAVFLHKQFEILMNDFNFMYKKFLYNSLNEENTKMKNNKNKLKKKILSIQNINKSSDMLLKNSSSNYLLKNKNIASVDDLMLKESKDFYFNDFNLGNNIFIDDNNLCHNAFNNICTLNCSKENNLYTLNYETKNLNTKEFSNNTNNLNTVENFFIEKNSNITSNIKDINEKTLKKDILKSNIYSKSDNNMKKGNTYIINTVITNNIFDMNQENQKNKFENKHNMDININENKNNKYNKKRMYREIDNQIMLKDNAWNDFKEIKKNKLKLFDINFLLFNKKRKTNDSFFFNFYDITKNYSFLDSRKNLYNVMLNHINANNMQTSNNKLINVNTNNLNKNNYSLDNSSFNFEIMRADYNEFYLNNIEESRMNKRKYQNISNTSNHDITTNIIHNFDQIDLQFKKNQSNKNNQSEEVHSFLNSLDNTLSVPSSKAIGKKSISSSQYTYDEEIIKLKTQINKMTEQNESINFDDICSPYKVSAKGAAMTFYNLLVLASNDEIKLSQNLSNLNIMIKSA